jgi:signal transduction histidine kinase
MALIPPAAMLASTALEGSTGPRHGGTMRVGNPSFGKILSVVSAMMGTMTACSLLEAASEDAVSRIRDIRTMSRDEAAKALPVRVSGTCIYAANGELFVHDGEHGIWVSSLTAESRGLLRDDSGLSGLDVGITVEIEGITDPGAYARQILPLAIRQTGSAALPAPVRITAEQLVAGSEDGQLVELEGVVQDVEVLADRTVCSLMAEGVACLVALHGVGGKNLPPLVDARVRAVGAFAPDFNNRSEVVRPKIISSAADSIRVLKQPPADPFESPRVELSALRGFAPDTPLFHRKVSSGVVTFVRPGEFFFLREGLTSVRVSSDAAGLQPGWRVDVAGFIDTTQHLAALRNAIVRKTGEESLPPPETATVRDLLTSASWRAFPQSLASDLSGHNVTLRGRIRRVDQASPLAPVAVWLETENLLFPAHLPPGTLLGEQQAGMWQLGAEAELTGACELEFRSRPDPLGLYDPIGFHVWLASPHDLTITRPAPWWTTRRLTIALSGTGLAALIAIGGVAVLRRQVKRQVGIIAKELETNAVSSERERIARDLHDTLEQQLTGVAMQLESLAKSPQSQSPGISDRISLASRMLQHSREEARRSVWDLRSRVLENHGFAAALESLAASAAIDGAPQVTTSITGSRAHLPSAVTYQLLRMAQESLTNALKHAHAENILITLDMSRHQYRLAISDDGCGFDAKPAKPPGPPHFGLIGMRERASRIGADLTITSRPGHGCTVSVTLPLLEP